MLINDFNRTINFWITELERYDFNQLCTKPSPTSWSLGQVYMHILEEAQYYLEQIKICASTNDNASEEMSAHAKTMFINNAFPDAIIEGPPTNSRTRQPESKEQLMQSIVALKNEITTVEKLLLTSRFKGKTKHPGLDYFDAKEWLQFADMHSRHHFRQKKRIEDFLRTNTISR